MLVRDYDKDINEGKAADYSLLSKNTIDIDTTAKDGDEDKFEQETIEIKRSGGIDCNNNQINEDNKEVEVELGTPDQHSNRLTLTQSTFEAAVENLAPA